MTPTPAPAADDRPLPGAAFALAAAPFGDDVAPYITRYLARWQPYRPFWNYEDGCIYKGALDLSDASGDGALFDFVAWAAGARVAADGTITGFDPREFNIDNVNAGKVLFDLVARTGEPRYAAAIEAQFAQLRAHPRTASGNYWHKQIYPSQVWLDGLYMAQPFVCAYARLHDDRALIDDVIRQFAHVRAVLRDDATGLYWHGWDEQRRERWADPVRGTSPHFWGRALGWFAMALVDCIAILARAPAWSHEPLVAIWRDLADALLRHRGDDALWYQVVDQREREGNYPEASASLMIAYALMRAARLGVSDARTGDRGEETLRACLSRFLHDDALHGICGVAGLGNTPYRDGSYAYYLSEKIVPDDPKGVGALMMALSEGIRRTR